LKRALISVYHKDGIEELARKLVDSGWEILSTGGTAGHLKKNQVPVTELASLTGFGEILNGRVKTLHPLIFAGILATSSPAHRQDLESISADRIDLVVVNFYPFEEALAEKEKNLDAMIETIDIGGPSMVRAAAKNHRETTVVVESRDYGWVGDQLAQSGSLTDEERGRLAQKAFAYTSFYDSLIASYLAAGDGSPAPYYTLGGRKKMDLRYGENPHQQGALYITDVNSPLNRMEKLQGKKLSFNNILDLSMVMEVLGVFRDDVQPLCVIVKHQNPCGAARNPDQKTAFNQAFEGDSKSAFGGIVGFNRPLDGPAADRMKKIFFEVILAPDFTREALDILKKRKKLRLIKIPLDYRDPWDVKKVPGGFVLQDRDQRITDGTSFELKTPRSLTGQEQADADFGWKMVKFVKSNGIIIVKNQQLIGVGAGQMSRVDAVELAIKKSPAVLKGAVLLSDAFFPFADSIEAAATAGIRVIVEPGGSIRDEEVIKAAREKNLSLVFTGIRHFRH